jgi:hypothetical protein
MKTFITLFLCLIASQSFGQWRTAHSGDSRPAILYPHDSMVFVHWDGGGVSWYTIGALGWAHADTGILPGQTDKKVNWFASIHHYLFAAGPGVNRSTNNGSSWSVMKTSQFYGASGLGTIDTMLLTCWHDTIRRSTDYGNTWTNASRLKVNAFATVDSIVYATTNNSFWHSTDSGVNWTKLSDTGGTNIFFIDSVIFLSSHNGPLARSMDGGSNWKVLSYPPIRGIGELTHSSQYIFLGGDDGLVDLSSDMGDTWSAVDNTGLPRYMTITAMCVFDSFVFAGGYDPTSSSGSGVFYRPISEIIPKSAVALPNVVAADLLRVYPNPFNSSCTIDLTLASNSSVRIVILDATGRVVATPISQRFESGEHSIPFDASSLPSGTYWCKLIADGTQRMAKVTILR